MPTERKGISHPAIDKKRRGARGKQLPLGGKKGLVCSPTVRGLGKRKRIEGPTKKGKKKKKGKRRGWDSPIPTRRSLVKEGRRKGRRLHLIP